MYFPCRPVELDFLRSAPVRISHAAELSAPPAAIFALFEDGASWPRWFADIRRVDWTTPEPRGVGTTRTVVLDALTVFEYFLAWEPAQRFAFRFDGHSLPIFRAFAEDYSLVPIAGGTRLTYTIVYELRPLFRPLGFLVRWRFHRMCREAAAGLAAYVLAASSSESGGTAPGA